MIEAAVAGAAMATAGGTVTAAVENRVDLGSNGRNAGNNASRSARPLHPSWPHPPLLLYLQLVLLVWQFILCPKRVEANGRAAQEKG